MIHGIDVVLICASFDNLAFFVYLPAGVYIGVASFLHISSSSTLLALLSLVCVFFPKSIRFFEAISVAQRRFPALLRICQQSALNAIVADSTGESTPKRVLQYFPDYLRAFSKAKA